MKHITLKSKASVTPLLSTHNVQHCPLSAEDAVVTKADWSALSSKQKHSECYYRWDKCHEDQPDVREKDKVEQVGEERRKSHIEWSEKNLRRRWHLAKIWVMGSKDQGRELAAEQLRCKQKHSESPVGKARLVGLSCRKAASLYSGSSAVGTARVEPGKSHCGGQIPSAKLLWLLYEESTARGLQWKWPRRSPWDIRQELRCLELWKIQDAQRKLKVIKTSGSSDRPRRWRQRVGILLTMDSENAHTQAVLTKLLEEKSFLPVLI